MSTVGNWTVTLVVNIVLLFAGCLEKGLCMNWSGPKWLDKDVKEPVGV
jgi:hypothetical protein